MNTEMVTPDDTKLRHTAHAEAAREQIIEAEIAFLKSEKLGNWTVPHKDLFDNDQQERWDDLMFERESYDREPDIAAADGTIIRRGDILVPYRKDKKRIPSPIRAKGYATEDEQYAVVCWGVDGAKKAYEEGVLLSGIKMIWAKQARALRKLTKQDSKSADRDSDLAAVPDGDRG